jgi:RNA polymerase sigma-70 factor (ECF subfamily)
MTSESTHKPGDPHPTQTQLLRDVRDAGNQQAWTSFHRIYAPLTRSFLRRMGLTEADVDDSTQEIMLTAHAALRDGVYDRSKGGFRAWLFGVARKKALMAHRARRRPSRVQTPEGDSGLHLLAGAEDKSAETEQQIWEQEWRYVLLGEAIQQLRGSMGENVYEAFLRYGVQRQPVDQVAADLGISTSSVYVYKQRALCAIRDWLAANEDRIGEPE